MFPGFSVLHLFRGGFREVICGTPLFQTSEAAVIHLEIVDLFGGDRVFVGWPGVIPVDDDISHMQ